MEKKDAYREKVRAQIKEWESMIDLLQARGEKAAVETKIEIRKAVENLRSEKNDLQKRLSEAMASGAEAWEDLKKGLEKAVVEMKSALDKAMAKFK
jgi:hypothetical protein